MPLTMQAFSSCSLRTRLTHLASDHVIDISKAPTSRYDGSARRFPAGRSPGFRTIAVTRTTTRSKAADLYAGNFPRRECQTRILRSRSRGIARAGGLHSNYLLSPCEFLGARSRPAVRRLPSVMRFGVDVKNGDGSARWKGLEQTLPWSLAQ